MHIFTEDEKPRLKAIVCDKCKRSFDIRIEDTWNDYIFFSHRSTTTKNSIFGNYNLVELDLCSECANELFGKYIKISKLTNNQLDDEDMSVFRNLL